MKMYLPSDWLDYSDSYSSTDESLVTGAALGSEDQSQMMLVSYCGSDDMEETFGVTDLDALKTSLESDGYTDMEIISVDGVDALRGGFAEQYGDASGLFVVDNDNGLYMITFIPASDAEYSAIVDNIIASITWL